MSIKEWLLRHYLFIGFILLLFIVPLFLPDLWMEKAQIIIQEVGYIPGLVILSVLLILATVIAPLNTLSLVPVASITFGWQITTLVLIFSWTIGAVIAFLIARGFGKGALNNWQVFRDAEKYSSRVPRDLSFLSLVFLRMLIPVDLLSYAVGLFTDISLFQYTLATLIGVTPFSFIWSYGGGAVLSKEYVSLFAVGGMAIVVVLIARYFYKRRKS